MKQREERTIRKKKIAIAIMEYLVILGCLITLFVMLTPKEKITKTASSYAKPEEVSKYKIENEYITRVRPLTEYSVFKGIAEETLKDNLGNSYEIRVYTNAEKEEEVTKGYITSGMVVECIRGEETEGYTVRVVGDLTGNGDCNVTELTQIIRHIVGLERINEEGKELSADFNGDNQINVTDVSMCINYIVYGTMEKDKEAPLNPEIKVEGEGNKETGWYRSEIEVEIDNKEREEGEIEKTQTIVESKLEGRDKPTIQSTEEKEFKLSKEGEF